MVNPTQPARTVESKETASMDLETGLNLLLHAVSSPAERMNSSDRASQASPASSGSIESDSESVTLDGDSDVEGDQTGPSALGGGPVVADTDIEEVEGKKRKIIQGMQPGRGNEKRKEKKKKSDEAVLIW